MDTGIIREVDDLGRFVLPKEIRRTYNITSGDKLSLHVENGDIILKKYSPLSKYKEFLLSLLKSANFQESAYIAICDTDTYLTNAIGKNDYVIHCKDKPISNGIVFAMRNANPGDNINMAGGIGITRLDNESEHNTYYAKKLFVSTPNKGGIVVITSKPEEQIVLHQAFCEQIRFIQKILKNIED